MRHSIPRIRARAPPGRDWFRHFVYAPGLLTGYGVKTLPSVREAIEGGGGKMSRRAEMTGGTAALRLRGR